MSPPANAQKGLQPSDPDPVTGVVPWEAVPQSGVAAVPVTGVAPWAQSAKHSQSYVDQLNAKLRAKKTTTGPSKRPLLAPVPWAKPPKRVETKEDEDDGKANVPRTYSPMGKMQGPKTFESGSIKK